LDSDGVLGFFSENFGFDDNETVALMGAHSIGTANRLHSGFHGPSGWVGTNRALNNGYYSVLVGPPDDMDFITDWFINYVDNSDIGADGRFQWTHTKGLGFGGDAHRLEDGREIKEGAKETFMLDSDIALVRNFSISRDGNLEHFFNSSTGMVSCEFRCRENDDCTVKDPSRCDSAEEYLDEKCRRCRCFDYIRRIKDDQMPVCGLARTIHQASRYRESNELWIADFEAVLKKMLRQGYQTQA
jgi:hypothetical protein